MRTHQGKALRLLTGEDPRFWARLSQQLRGGVRHFLPGA